MYYGMYLSIQLLWKLKIEDYKDGEFEVQTYFHTLNISNARTLFKLKYHMLPTIKMNFQSDQKFALEVWKCEGCSEVNGGIGYRDTQSHVFVWEGYALLRQDKDLSQDKDLVGYFNQVLKQRQETSEVKC